jgi:hypothetical protein
MHSTHNNMPWQVPMLSSSQQLNAKAGTNAVTDVGRLGSSDTCIPLSQWLRLSVTGYIYPSSRHTRKGSALGRGKTSTCPLVVNATMRYVHSQFQVAVQQMK